jgi:hypothetical protein
VNPGGTPNDRKLFQINGRTTNIYYQLGLIKLAYSGGDKELGFIDSEGIITLYSDLDTRKIIEAELGPGYVEALQGGELKNNKFTLIT